MKHFKELATRLIASFVPVITTTNVNIVSMPIFFFWLKEAIIAQFNSATYINMQSWTDAFSCRIFYFNIEARSL